MAINENPGPGDHDDELVPVQLPSTGVFWLYAREVVYFNDRVKRYLEDNLFSNVSDLQDLDRVVIQEVLCWRWQIWVSSQKDYWFEPIDEKDLQKQVKESSQETRAVKQTLGLDKVTRDKVKGEDSVSRYIDNLKIRAREFGIMREDQLGKALELFNDLKAELVLLENTTVDERQEMKKSPEDFMRWIHNVLVPKFDAIDNHFKQNKQRFWIREQ